MKTITSTVKSNGTAQSSSVKTFLQGKYFVLLFFFSGHCMSEQEAIFWMCKITRCARALNYSCCPIEMGYFYHMKLLRVPYKCPAGAFCNHNHHVCLGLGALKDLLRILSVYRFPECKKWPFTYNMLSLMTSVQFSMVPTFCSNK